MPSPALLHRRAWLGLATSALLAPAAFAQIPATAATPELRGMDSQGRPFDLAAQRGRVVMVVFWSTECAVCRDKMPELRANLRGWQGQAFTLVGVNTDPEQRSFDEWERLVALTVRSDSRFPQLWRGDPAHRDSFGQPGTLPATWLIDKQGRITDRFNGRIPAEAWNRVADLL